MFNLGVQAERVCRKPYIPMLPESPPRQGFFEAEEFAALLAALPDYLKPVAEFGYRTGWRRDEITSFSGTALTFKRARFGYQWGTTKNDEGRVLPLEADLWDIIEAQSANRVEGCPWVFHRRGRRIGTFYKAWDRACAKAECDGKLFHDFRRTVVRNTRRAGIAEQVALQITGHKTAHVFRRYDPMPGADLREAVWKLQAISSPGGAKVGQTMDSTVSEAEADAGQLVGKSVG